MTHLIASSNWHDSELDAPDIALCEFAKQLTCTPNQMSEGHILDLRSQGFSDQGIHDATQVISYFNYINRIADSLDVDLEDDVHAWELSTPN